MLLLLYCFTFAFIINIKVCCNHFYFRHFKDRIKIRKKSVYIYIYIYIYICTLSPLCHSLFTSIFSSDTILCAIGTHFLISYSESLWIMNFLGFHLSKTVHISSLFVKNFKTFKTDLADFFLFGIVNTSLKYSSCQNFYLEVWCHSLFFCI
jgi:hypothetical protein